MSDVAIAFTDGSTGPALTPVPTPVVIDATQTFEGAQVGMTEIKISGACTIDAADMTVTLDDRIRAVGEYRVVKVLHYVHPKTGETVRQQVLAPIVPLVIVPYDPANPNDDGVIRARP